MDGWMDGYIHQKIAGQRPALLSGQQISNFQLQVTSILHLLSHFRRKFFVRLFIFFVVREHQ